MATVDRVFLNKRGDVTAIRSKVAAGVTLTMAAGATTTLSFTPPEGSRVSAIKWHTATTFTGSPTNIYLTVGKTAGGQDYVANTDVKTATAPTAASLVAIADWASWPVQAMFCTLTANGGTNPAGTCVVEIDYAPANP